MIVGEPGMTFSVAPGHLMKERRCGMSRITGLLIRFALASGMFVFVFAPRDAAPQVPAAPIALVVRTDDTHEPVPGAVAWISRPCADPMSRVLDPEWVRANGARFTANASGGISIDEPEERCLLLVTDREEKPERLAIRVLDPADEEIESPFVIELPLDHSCRVRVRDADGNPAPNVPLVLDGPRGVLLRARSSALDGLVDVPHAQCIPEPRSVHEIGFALRTAIPLLDRQSIRTNVYVGELQRQDTATIDLPPSGRVCVVAREHDGTPCARPIVAWIDSGLSPDAESELGERGAVEFPFVRTGTKLELIAMPADGSAPFVTVTAAGPARAGDSITVEVTLAEDTAPRKAGASICEFVAPMFVVGNGRFDPMRIEAHVTGHGRRFDGTARIDGDRAVFTFEQFRDPRAIAGLSIEVWDAHGYRDAFIHVQGNVVPGRHVLDPIEWRETEEWVSGRVIDEAGRGVAGCRVTARAWDAWIRGERPRIEAPSTRSDATGAFRIRATPPMCNGLRLSFRPPRDLAVRDAFCAIGAVGQVVIARPRAEILGRLLLPEDVEGEGLEIRYECLSRSYRVHPASSGEFTLAPELPGRGRLAVYLPLEHEPIVAIPEVALEAGATIPPIDLRELVRAVAVHVVDDTGAPHTRAELWIAGAPDRTLRASHDGVARFATSLRPVEVRAKTLVGNVTLFGAVTLTAGQREAWLRIAR